MKIDSNIGIVAYGSSIPQLAIAASEIEQAQGREIGSLSSSLGTKQKTVPAIDEDTITLAVDAGWQALARLEDEAGKAKSSIGKSGVGCLFVGSESHPYAVKPSGTVVAEALGLPRGMALADLQFACKAGTQALQIVLSYVQSDMCQLGLAIGADTAQSAPGDVLELTAGAGAAAFVVGRENNKKQKSNGVSPKILAKILATTSYVSDTPDFWRRAGQPTPQHAGRFTGEPAYFHHVMSATKQLLEETKLKPQDIDYVIFHTPNAKFPKVVAKLLGFDLEKLKFSLVVEQIGNTYAASSLMALANVLDSVEAGKKILLTSYGSGAGADSFLFETTQALVNQRKNWDRLLENQISQLELVSYQQYRKNTQHSH